MRIFLYRTNVCCVPSVAFIRTFRIRRVSNGACARFLKRACRSGSSVRRRSGGAAACIDDDELSILVAIFSTWRQMADRLRPGLPRDQFSGPWLFSTAEARTINSSSWRTGSPERDEKTPQNPPTPCHVPCGKRPPAPRKPKGKPGRPFVGARGGGSVGVWNHTGFTARFVPVGRTPTEANMAEGPVWLRPRRGTNTRRSTATNTRGACPCSTHEHVRGTSTAL